jgi:hypothetical protein
MTAVSGMDFANGSEASHIEVIGHADQGWPLTAMNIGDLAVK